MRGLGEKQMKPKYDLIGYETKYVKVLRKAVPEDGGPTGAHPYLICECKNCGKKLFVYSSSIRPGKQEYDHCGCLSGREPKYPFRPLDEAEKAVSVPLTDLRAGIETPFFRVIRKAEKDKNEPTGRSGSYWLCECKRCGRKVFMQRQVLTGHGTKMVQSCGCLAGRQPAYPFIDQEEAPHPVTERLESAVSTLEQTLKFCELDFGIPEDDKTRQECIMQLEHGKEIISLYVKKCKGEHNGNAQNDIHGDQHP